MRIGIDCGVTGAIALIQGSRLWNIWDMPVYTEQTKTGKNRNFICSKQLDVVLTEVQLMAVSFCPPLVFVEKQGANKGVGPKRMNKDGTQAKDTPLTAYSIGYNYSTIREALRRSSANYHEIESVSWKRRAGLKKGATKKDSLYLARELFGDNEFFKRIKDHNRAEAALIAYFGD